jgi:hypothetical protein
MYLLDPVLTEIKRQRVNPANITAMQFSCKRNILTAPPFFEWLLPVIDIAYYGPESVSPCSAKDYGIYSDYTPLQAGT